jgi:hypothetical protein
MTATARARLRLGLVLRLELCIHGDSNGGGPGGASSQKLRINGVQPMLNLLRRRRLAPTRVCAHVLILGRTAS